MPSFVDCVDRMAFSKYSTVNGPHPGLTGLRVAVGGVQSNGGLLQRCRVKDRLLVAEIQGAGLEGQEELAPKSLRWWSGWTRILRIAATPGPLRWSAPCPRCCNPIPVLGTRRAASRWFHYVRFTLDSLCRLDGITPPPSRLQAMLWTAEP